MFGILFNEQEKEEVIYLLKREMDEILFDLDDIRIEDMIKQTMEARYGVLFSLFKRMAPPKDCMKYMLPAARIRKDSRPKN